eukprot:923017-Amphidinium_carterae.1
MKELGKQDLHMSIDQCLVAHLAGSDGADELKLQGRQPWRGSTSGILRCKNFAAAHQTNVQTE